MDAARKRQRFAEGIACFNRREFFTCHEVLEEIWLEEPPTEKRYYQGLIQVAAGFHHFLNGNRVGTASLLRAGAEKLRTFPLDYGGLDLRGLLTALQPWLERLEHRQELDDLPLPKIRTLPSSLDSRAPLP